MVITLCLRQRINYIFRILVFLMNEGRHIERIIYVALRTQGKINLLKSLPELGHQPVNACIKNTAVERLDDIFICE